MAFVGADTGQLRELAALMERRANELTGDLVPAISGRLASSPWQGPDRQQFDHQWNTQLVHQIRNTATALDEAAKTARKNADDQDRTSQNLDGPLGNSGGGGTSGGGLSSGGGRSNGNHSADFLDWFLNDLIIGSSDKISKTLDHSSMLLELISGERIDFLDVMPNGSFLDAGLKGVSLGDASARLAAAIRDNDLSGGMLAVADGVFTFTPQPVSWLWSGMKGTTEFFIPLDKSSQETHLGWMQERGYSPTEIVDRYDGAQGVINLGNDNVERHAPWINRVADNVLQKPAEWLYNCGIKLY